MAMTTMTTPRMLGAIAAAALSILVGGGAAHAAGPLDNPGFSKVITCSACHGQSGNSKSDMMPIIAGLDPAYFKKQIENYAAGRRPSPEMEPYAKQIQFLGLDEIAAYFGGQKREATLIRVSPDAVAKGKVAAAQCVICHGHDGRGDPARLIPGLAGQPPGYLVQQMLLFKQDTRDPGEPLLAAKKALMRVIPDGQFTELAAYYSSLR